MAYSMSRLRDEIEHRLGGSLSEMRARDPMTWEVVARNGNRMLISEQMAYELSEGQCRYSIHWRFGPSRGDMYSGMYMGMPVYTMPPKPPDEYTSDYADAVQYAFKSMKIDYGMAAPDPVSACKMCGERHGAVKLDHHGFCPNRAKQFWTKVRDLYWHRASKDNVPA